MDGNLADCYFRPYASFFEDSRIYSNDAPKRSFYLRNDSLRQSIIANPHTKKAPLKGAFALSRTIKMSDQAIGLKLTNTLYKVWIFAEKSSSLFAAAAKSTGAPEFLA